MKFLFELFPVALFFACYHITGDLYLATGSAIAATVLQVALSWWRTRQVGMMLWLNLGVISIMGGLTLWLHNKTFIFWKPTLLFLLFAAGLCGSWWLKRINPIEKLYASALEGQFNLPESAWLNLLWSWVAFFVVMAGVNLLVVYQFSEAFWVNFKLFGLTGLMLVFSVLQMVYISRFGNEESANSAETSKD